MLTPHTRTVMLQIPHKDAAAVTTGDCRAALVRVLTSESFKAAPRLSAFLQFIVEAALSTPAVPVKAYTIAVGALERGPDFDPVTDAIVRVEAGRLRRTLARYYDDTGVQDPLIILVPRGGYVPAFRWRSPADDPSRGALLADVRLIARMTSAMEVHRQQQELLMRNLTTLRSRLDRFRSEVRDVCNVLSRRT